MNKKLMSLVVSGILAGSLMVGCSSSNTNIEPPHLNCLRQRLKMGIPVR